MHKLKYSMLPELKIISLILALLFEVSLNFLGFVFVTTLLKKICENS